jgi:hypothetical protein
MIKVLKSFTSAHDAVNWMTQNRIEDTSIEMTGTLKSLGVVKIPSGNYHVVLKGRVSPNVIAQQAGFPSAQGMDLKELKRLQSLVPATVSNLLDGDRSGQHRIMVSNPRPHSLLPIDTSENPELQTARFLDESVAGAGGSRAGGVVRNAGAETVLPIADRGGLAIAKPGIQMPLTPGMDVTADSIDSGGKDLVVPPDAVVDPNRREPPGSPNPIKPPKPKNDTKSISREDLVTIITKSVVDVLKRNWGMGVISRDSLKEAEREFEDNAGSWRPMIDTDRMYQDEEMVEKESNRLLGNRPGDKTRAERVARVLARANERLKDAREIQESITDPDGGEPGQY